MSNPIRVTIHQAGDGLCSLSGKDGEGLTVSFDDGTVTDQHLSWKSFRQLVAMKTAQTATKPVLKPMPIPPSIVPPAVPFAVSNSVIK